MYMYYILCVCNMYMCNYRFYGDLSIQKNITIHGTWMDTIENTEQKCNLIYVQIKKWLKSSS